MQRNRFDKVNPRRMEESQDSGLRCGRRVCAPPSAEVALVGVDHAEFSECHHCDPHTIASLTAHRRYTIASLTVTTQTWRVLLAMHRTRLLTGEQHCALRADLFVVVSRIALVALFFNTSSPMDT